MSIYGSVKLGRMTHQLLLYVTSIVTFFFNNYETTFTCELVAVSSSIAPVVDLFTWSSSLHVSSNGFVVGSENFFDW